MSTQINTPPEVLIGARAADQHGLVTTRQLRSCGVDSRGIAWRVAGGRLHRVHRGVYAVGHAGLTRPARFMAAVLACGRGAALSHFSAAAHLGFLRWAQRQPEVTVVRATAPVVAGIRVHRARSLDGDVVWHDGICVTSAARTLLDLAVVLTTRALRRAVRQAQAEGLVSVRRLRELLERSNGHHGVGALRAAVAQRPAPTRSELEDVVLDLLDGAGIERPAINAPLRLAGRTIKPDFLWPGLRLVLEADGAAWHDHRLAREDDADRQALLEAAGYRVLRITWEQAVRRPHQTLERIRAALAQA